MVESLLESSNMQALSPSGSGAQGPPVGGEGSSRGCASPGRLAAAGAATISVLTLAAVGAVGLHQSRMAGAGSGVGAIGPLFFRQAVNQTLTHGVLSAAATTSGSGMGYSRTGMQGHSGDGGSLPAAVVAMSSWGVRPGCDPGHGYEDDTLPWWCDASSIQLVAGTALGYIATVMYLSSRVSQIAKNAARRSAEGLSLIMFLLTMMANCCTGLSILLRLGSTDALKQQLPWLAGAFGTVGLDMTIALQSRMYQRSAAAAVAAAASGASLTAPLLEAGV